MALRILIVLLILAVPLELPGCGPFLPQALFYLPTAPESPDLFAKGELGILRPAYERKYQVVAYRYLAGIGLSSGEQQAALSPPPPDPNAPFPDPINRWLAARNQVPNIQHVNYIYPYRNAQKEGLYFSYLNCNDDAFRTAAATLQRWRDKPGEADWIGAQDLVFSNCDKGAAIPPPSSLPELRADRAYQIASAKFYSEQYDAARQDFQAIARDTASPWHDIAPYLAARCLLRAGDLAQAQSEFERIAADPAQARWHAPANGLLGYIRSRLHRAERMHELALAVVKPNSQATLQQDLADYRLLFDQNVKPQPSDDLSDWIVSFQSNGAGALERWRAAHTLPWLVAALNFAAPGQPELAELLRAAAAVKPDSPGYSTVNYHRVRLLPPADARALADQLLAEKNLPAAAQNQFRGQRMALARDFNEFLRYAPRRPVAVQTESVDPAKTNEDDLDNDSVDIFNQHLPLAYWKRAQASNLLPAHVRDELGRVIFVRTLLLSDAPSFDQVFTLLQSPGMQLNIDAGLGRDTKEIDKIDDFRDNWWCGASTEAHQNPPESAPAPRFLTAAETQEAAVEKQKLDAAGAAPDWLGAQTLAFAEKNPQDPRVTEALYRVVRASRFGCTDDKTGDFSKRAFDLLHRRYPASEWTKKTPYWYK